MKILYTLNSGNPGGMEQHVLDLIKGMIAAKHEVFVWCANGVIADWYKNAGATVVTKKINLDIDPIYIYKLYKFLKTHQINVIHAHELKASANSLLAAFFAGTKMRITHTHTPLSEWQINPVIKKINVMVYAFIVNMLANYEIALTTSRKKVKIAEGIKPQKLIVIPNAVETQKFNLSNETKESHKAEMLQKYKIPENTFIFGNVSRLTVEKNHHNLILAFWQFLQKAQKQHAHLLIAGGGELESNLKNLISNLKIQQNVTITGRFSEQDHIKLYASMDAFVFPSFAEGFGIVLIEAMAAKLPIICSDLEVLREVADGTVFAYVSPTDPKQLANEMLRLHRTAQKDENQLVKLASKSALRVENLYTLDKFTADHLKLYENTNARSG